MTDVPAFEDILYEKRDSRAAWIIINRPKLYNAFRAQTMEELTQGLPACRLRQGRLLDRIDGRRRQGVLHGGRSERA